MRYVIVLGPPHVYGVIGSFERLAVAKKFASRHIEGHHAYVICDVYSPASFFLVPSRLPRKKAPRSSGP